MTSVIVYAFAVWSVAWTLSSEEGPFNVFGKIRDALRPRLGEGVDCPICVGFYAAIALYVVWFTGAAIVLVPLAAHGFVTMLTLFLARRR